MLQQPDRRKGSSISPSPDLYMYRVYGLIVQSQLELPELVPVPVESEPDVKIRFGTVPQRLDNPVASLWWCTASDSEFIFTINGVAHFHIARGSTITIDRRMGLSCTVRDADIRVWLLGSAFGAVLHQRGLLPLHVSAVKTQSRVWAFTGESGEGKSTLAGFLMGRVGYQLFSDDVSVLQCRDDGSLLFPGPRKLKLCGDALEYLQLPQARVKKESSYTEKYQLYLDRDEASDPASLHALVVLESVPDDVGGGIERLNGVEAFNALLGTIYRPMMNRWFNRAERTMTDLASLCQSIAIYRFRRRRSLDHYEENLRPLIDLIESEEAGQ